MAELANRPAGSVQAPDADRDLAVLALDLGGWTDERALALQGDPAAALARLSEIATPLKVEERERGPKTEALMGALRTIGAKMSPTMSGEQVNVWIAAMVTALSDLPYAFVIRGARDAVHVPMTFLNEVEKVVREKAEEARMRHLVAKRRLEHLQRRAKAAARPALPKAEFRPMTQEEMNDMARADYGRAILRLGVLNGHITQEQYDAALASRDERKDEE